MSNGINWDLLNLQQNPFNSFLGGLQRGMERGQIADNRAIQQEKMEAWRADRARQEEMLQAQALEQEQIALRDEEFKGEMTRFYNGEIGVDQLFSALSPEEVDEVKKSWETSSGIKAEQGAKFSNHFLGLMKAGQVDSARNMLSRERDKMLAQGNEVVAGELEADLETLDSKPDDLLKKYEVTRGFLSPDTTKKMAESRKTAEEAEGIALQNKKTLDLMVNPPPETMAKETIPIYNENQARFQEVNKAQAVLTDLSGLFDIKDSQGEKIKLDLGGKTSNWLRNAKTAIDGLEDDDKAQVEARVINQFKALRLVESLRQKPPGAMSEGELNALLATAPSEDSSAEMILNWVSDLDKAYRRAAASEVVRTAYMSTLNSHTPPKTGKTIEVNGKKVRVRPHESPDALISRIGPKRLLTYAPDGDFGLSEAPAAATPIETTDEDRSIYNAILEKSKAK
jgi:hypothetical protein